MSVAKNRHPFAAHVLTASVLGFSLLSSGLARAGGDGAGVLNGATVEWVSASSFRVGWGTTTQQASTWIEQAGGTFLTSTVWASAGSSCSVGIPSQTLNTVFYVYQVTTVLSGQQIVVSLVPPFEDGYAQSNFDYPNGSGGCTTSANGYDYIFLGSFIVASGGSIIQFARHGEEVILEFNRYSGVEAPLWGTVFTGPGNYEATVGTPRVGTAIPIPSSASAMIFDIDAYSTDASHSHELQILDPSASVPIAIDCTTISYMAPMVADLYLASGTAAGTWPQTLGAASVVSASRRINFPTVAGSLSADLNALVCDTYTWAGNVGFMMRLAGYIEPVHHMNQNR